MHLSLAAPATTKTSISGRSSRRRGIGTSTSTLRTATATAARKMPTPPPTTTTAHARSTSRSDATTPSLDPAAAATVVTAGLSRLSGGASASTSGRDALRPVYSSVMAAKKLAKSTTTAATATTAAASAAAAAASSSAPSPSPRTAAAATALGLVDESGSLSLANVRASLIRQEDTIVFSLIERAQFALNAPVYERGLLPGLPLFPRSAAENVGQVSTSKTSNNVDEIDQMIAPSLLEHMLRETEAVHGRVRRYTSPDEHAFYPSLLPVPLLPPLAFASSPLAKGCAERINLNGLVLSAYLDYALPMLTKGMKRGGGGGGGGAEGGSSNVVDDDGNYGSAALGDVAALQALSKRVHYGKFVAEAKYRASRDEYRALAAARDEAGIMERLTDAAVEETVVARVRAKAAAFGREVVSSSDKSLVASASSSDAGGGEDGGDTPLKVDPDAVAEFYRGWVLPLTKDVQVRYLLERPRYDDDE